MTPLDSLRIYSEDGLSPLPIARLFGRDAPLTVDVGCGKGRFLLARAKDYPDVNFLGVDRMLRRIRKVDNKATRLSLHNVRLLRMEAYYTVSYLLPADAVSTYFILFPDPWPKKRHHDHRLFNPRFIDALHRTLCAGGLLHFATDHLPYFEEVVEQLRRDARFTEVPAWEPQAHERTDFEGYYLDKKPIGRASFLKA